MKRMLSGGAEKQFDNKEMQRGRADGWNLAKELWVYCTQRNSVHIHISWGNQS